MAATVKIEGIWNRTGFGGCLGNQSAPAMSNSAPIWETKLPFEIEPGDGALIAKAMRAYRPDSSEEEGIVQFFIEQFEKLDRKQ